MKLYLPASLLVRKTGPKRKIWKSFRVVVGAKSGYLFLFDGAEIGSTGVEKMWRLPCWPTLFGQNYKCKR